MSHSSRPIFVYSDVNEAVVCVRVGCISGVSAQQMFLGGQDKAWRVFPS